MIPTSLPTNLITVTADITARIAQTTNLEPSQALDLLIHVLTLHTTQNYLLVRAAYQLTLVTPTHNGNPQQ